ncbi:hypothetical protein K440DRAFT_643371 [Wilcoxina mikolae CBS 423.85]|nr:hypothetical protein K440DRAFT_643371 [Wilcoxina mikolae CBS 423.85]
MSPDDAERCSKLMRETARYIARRALREQKALDSANRKNNKAYFLFFLDSFSFLTNTQPRNPTNPFSRSLTTSEIANLQPLDPDYNAYEYHREMEMQKRVKAHMQRTLPVVGGVKVELKGGRGVGIKGCARAGRINKRNGKRGEMKGAKKGIKEGMGKGEGAWFGDVWVPRR